jgi:membrane-associated phospholipid phosphatase
MPVSSSPNRAVQVWSGLLGVAGLLLAFLVLTVLIPGPLRPIDLALNHERGQDFLMIRPYLEVLDLIGQRGLCVPILVAVAARAAYLAKTWRPLIVTGASVLAVNTVVAAFKFGLERGSPIQNEPDFLTGGVMYPSGHAANVVLVYGLAAYLWCRYTDASRKTNRWLVVVVVALTVIMVATSLSLRWHWFTDLIGGVLVGAAALRATVVVDRAIPFTPLTETQEPVTRPSDEHLRPRRMPEPPYAGRPLKRLRTVTARRRSWLRSATARRTPGSRSSPSARSASRKVPSDTE